MVSLGMDLMRFTVRWFAVPIVALIVLVLLAAFVEITRDTLRTP